MWEIWLAFFTTHEQKEEVKLFFRWLETFSFIFCDYKEMIQKRERENTTKKAWKTMVKSALSRQMYTSVNLSNKHDTQKEQKEKSTSEHKIFFYDLNIKIVHW